MAAPKRASEDASQGAKGARFLIVEARFYDAIGAELLAGAQAAFAAADASCDVIRVLAVVTTHGILSVPLCPLKLGSDATFLDNVFH